MKYLDFKSLIIGILGTMALFFFLGASSYYDIDDVMSKLNEIESNISSIESIVNDVYYYVDDLEDSISDIESDVSDMNLYGVDCN